jgi:hypothetical protein
MSSIKNGMAIQMNSEWQTLVVGQGGGDAIMGQKLEHQAAVEPNACI